MRALRLLPERVLHRPMLLTSGLLLPLRQRKQSPKLPVNPASDVSVAPLPMAFHPRTR